MNDAEKINLPFDLLVRTKENEEAIGRIEEVTQIHDAPELIFLVGPAESGKTELLRTRELQKDLLSTKKVRYRPCKELPEALRADVYEGYLEELGSVDVLLLDDFEGFFEDAELGPQMCKLLLQERARRGLDTVISASKPRSEFDLSEFVHALDGFEEVRIGKLGEEGMLDYVRMLADLYDSETSPVLSDEALRYVALELDETMEAKRKAMHYLLAGYVGEPRAELSRGFVIEALKKDAE